MTNFQDQVTRIKRYYAQLIPIVEYDEDTKLVFTKVAAQKVGSNDPSTTEVECLVLFVGKDSPKMLMSMAGAVGIACYNGLQLGLSINKTIVVLSESYEKVAWEVDGVRKTFLEVLNKTALNVVMRRIICLRQDLEDFFPDDPSLGITYDNYVSAIEMRPGNRDLTVANLVYLNDSTKTGEKRND